jgi:Fe-S-cluster-containing dehydrogenase component
MITDTEMVPPLTLSRRELVQRLGAIGAGGLAAALSVGAGVSILAAPQPARAGTAGAGTPTRRRFRYGMVIDTRRCVGCRACVVACKAENKTPPGVSYTVVVEEAVANRFDDKPIFMTKPCFHCENPPCVDVCPVSATFKREQDGIVVIDYDRCIGCRYCVTACPYGARYFDFGENYAPVAAGTAYAQVPSPEYGQFRKRTAGTSPVGNVRKCTFCLHLQDAEGRYDKGAGRWPACAKTCTGHAIFFGDFADPESEVSRLVRERQPVRLKEELGTEPNVHYLL